MLLLPSKYLSGSKYDFALKNYEICAFLFDYFNSDWNDIRTDAYTQISILSSQLKILIDEYTEKRI